MDVTELVPTDRLAPALVEATGDPAWSDFEVTLVAGGKSNLTFLLRSGVGELVLRRPPTGKLLPSAHDMARETRVQRGLHGTGVPVAEIVLADQGDLIGIACYVMEKVEGHVIRGDFPAGYAEAPEQRRELSFAFIDTLAALHRVDQEAVGLGDYGRPDGHMERQVRRWGKQWEASRSHEVPEIDELGRRLAKRVPTQQRASVVHGDFRIDNVVYHPTDPGQIRAVLDWELSTLGDPISDVGLLMLFWREAGEGELSLIPGVTHLPGMADRDAMLARYAATTGADLSDIAFYQAFAHFKFAIIAQGVSARSKAGSMGGQDFGDLDAEILDLARAGLDLI